MPDLHIYPKNVQAKFYEIESGKLTSEHIGQWAYVETHRWDSGLKVYLPCTAWREIKMITYKKDRTVNLRLGSTDSNFPPDNKMTLSKENPDDV